MIAVTAVGKGDAVLQSVLRYNVPERRTEISDVFDITVDYGTDHVEVDDPSRSQRRSFHPSNSNQGGHGGAHVACLRGSRCERPSASSSRRTPASNDSKSGSEGDPLHRGMLPGETVSFGFQARAKYPVRAKEVVSQVYSYYRPEHRGETLGGAMTVTH